MGVYLPLPNRGIITISGDDRFEFLQGLVSNDLDRCAAGEAIWAALLTPQGKYLHDFFILDWEGRLLIDCEAERLMELGQLLNKYKLRARIEFGIADDLAVAALPDGLAELNGTSVQAHGKGVAFGDPRHADMGARAILPAAELAAEDGQEALALEYDLRRIQLAVPDGSRDLTPNKSLLMESGFDELHGIDWQKGCYVGQELTARTKYRGLVKKRLMPLKVEETTPAPGTPVMLGDREAGQITSVSGSWALALMRLERVEAAERDGVALSVDGAAVETCLPDWLTLGGET